MDRKVVYLIIVFALILAACAGPAGQATEPEALPVTGTEVVPAGTSGPAAETQAETTVSAADAMSGVVVYALAPEESTVTYEVGETFIDRGNVFNLAVGQTQGVTGDIQVNFDQPQETVMGPLTVDISGFQSDSSRRDRAIQDRFLQSNQFPMATFTPTAVEGLPETIEPGVEYPLTLRGDLTIRETTKPATFAATVSLQADGLTGQAVTTILMSDYGFGPIDMLGVLKTEDEVKVTVDFVARPQ
jgi:polyisoprenoid-binding protein YceI